MLQRNSHTVLLIEADRSLRRLIALGLQYRGMHVIEASSPIELPVLEAQRSELIVLDIDGEAGSDHSLLLVARAHPYLSSLPMVVLAWDCSVPTGIHQDASQTQVTCLAKPFDARTLHATIEQILGVIKETGAASKQEVLLAAYSATPTPSIWPLITAVGLLLSFIGLMTQITISALGLLIVIIALLWWTLGTKAEHEPLVIEMGKI
jgi:DNA-binding NtrC family response regulator